MQRDKDRHIYIKKDIQRREELKADKDKDRQRETKTDIDRRREANKKDSETNAHALRHIITAYVYHTGLNSEHTL